MTNVSWLDAVAFCRWLSQHVGDEIRLPPEWEWQQAATGGNPTNTYPWGAEWHSAYGNTDKSGLGRATAVGLYPQGTSTVGALDMSGNVWEWCLNQYEPPERIDLAGDAIRVVRGGSWISPENYTCTAYRHYLPPDARKYIVGFRLACSSPPPSQRSNQS